MLKNLLTQAQSNKIKKFRQQLLEETVKKIARLKKLIGAPDSGWPEFVEILNEYKKHLEKRKALTSLDTATPDTIDELKKVDHERWMLGFILGAINKHINKVEQEKLEIKRRENEETARALYGR